MSEFEGKLSALLDQSEQDRRRKEDHVVERARRDAERQGEEQRIVEEIWRPVLIETVEILERRGWTASVSDDSIRAGNRPRLGIRLQVGKYSVTYYSGSRDLDGPRGKSQGGTLRAIDTREGFEAEVLSAVKELTEA